MKLRQAAEQYLSLKQSLGFRFRTETNTLRAFSRAMGKISTCQVKPRAVRAFLNGRGPVTRHWICQWGTLRGFYRFAMARGWARQSPLPHQAPKVAVSFTPYIYSQEELRRMLQAITPELTKSLSTHTMQTLLLLVYGAGLRLSEALNLDDADVDLKERLLWVRCSKFFKTRLVPIGPKLARVLAGYEQKRPMARGSNRRFFREENGTPVSSAKAQAIFRTLCVTADIKRTDGACYQPRLHDLRHSAAVHRLVAWYRQGEDLQARLIQLSAYLGHVDLVSTQKYLTLTPELRAEASARFARYVWGGSNE